METIEAADEFEIDTEVHDIDFAEIVRKVNEDVSGSSESIRKGLTSSNSHGLFSGTGTFVDDRTVEVVDGDDEGATLRADTVLIATGTRPSIPPIDGIEDVSVTGDALLVAAGRRPNTDALDLDAMGVETDEAGFVETDEYL